MKISDLLKDKSVFVFGIAIFVIFILAFFNGEEIKPPSEITESLPAKITQSSPVSGENKPQEEEQKTLTEEQESQTQEPDTESEPKPPPKSESHAELEPQSEPEPGPVIGPCADIHCSNCQYCSAGYCINYCQDTDSDCGCADCIDCNQSDGWFNAGPSYSCCDENQLCSCQQKEYRDYFCFEKSCSYSVTNTKIVKSDCSNCGSNQYCLEGECHTETPSEPSEPSEPSGGIICSHDTYNCSDFTTQAEAQGVYNTCGGVSNDIHRLDRDKDGEPCESLP